MLCLMNEEMLRFVLITQGRLKVESKHLNKKFMDISKMIFKHLERELTR